MIAFVLLALVIMSDGPHAAHAYFQTEKECQVAAEQSKTAAIAAGITEGSFVCVKQETGKFS